MAVNDDLHVLMALGYFDLVMPTAQGRLAAEMAHLPPNRTSVKFYAAGHSQTGGPATALLAEDIRAFIRKAIGR
jgi:carboxypeptidase C (cathepsin A)